MENTIVLIFVDENGIEGYTEEKNGKEALETIAIYRKKGYTYKGHALIGEIGEIVV